MSDAREPGTSAADTPYATHFAMMLSRVMPLLAARGGMPCYVMAMLMLPRTCPVYVPAR